VSKPTWAPNMTDEDKRAGWRFCQCCGWRRTQLTFCETCLRLAAEAPRQSPRPVPVRVTMLQKQRGRMTSEQERYIESILPVTCRLCGHGGHTSADCPNSGLDKNVDSGYK
jgi:hypothetical protein